MDYRRSRDRSRSLGEVALRSQLNSAQQKINSLEVFIRDRERHHQVLRAPFTLYTYK